MDMRVSGSLLFHLEVWRESRRGRSSLQSDLSCTKVKAHCPLCLH